MDKIKKIKKCSRCSRPVPNNTLTLVDIYGKESTLCPECSAKENVHEKRKMAGYFTEDDINRMYEKSLQYGSSEDEYQEEYERYMDAEDGEKEISKTEFMHPSQIKAELDRHIIGQEDAKKVIAVAIYNHYKRISTPGCGLKKSNILLLGPSGVGKTELARSLAKMLDLPFTIADATTLTEAGYVGDDVESILAKLLDAADGDVQKAERGIIYIDEIDKIARKGENVSITRDVSGEGVQQSLLKIIEGSVCSIAPQGGRKHPYGDRIEINTENILFIAGGAFESITMAKEEKVTPKEKIIGFAAVPVSETVEKEKKQTPDIRKKLAKAGIIPELSGRFSTVAVLQPLDVDTLKRIFTEVDDSVEEEYHKLFALDGVELTFTDEAKTLIAQNAFNKGTGARGLRSEVEELMTDTMFRLPDMPEIDKVSVNAADEKLIVSLHKSATA